MRIVWFLLSGLCHQLPDHSLTFGGLPLPLCARCTGLFTGAVLTFFTLWAMRQGRRASLPKGRLAVFLGALAFAWGVDGANSFCSTLHGTPFLYRPSNALRLATGLGLGMGVGVLLYSITHQVLGTWHLSQPPLAERGAVLVPIGINAAWGALLLGWPKAPYWPLFWVTFGAAYLTLEWVNALLWGILLRREGRYAHLEEAWPVIALGGLSALGEMAFLGYLRLALIGTP